MAVREEYVKLSELKAAATLAPTTIDRDELLAMALDAAHDAVETSCGRKFWLDELASARDYDPAERLVFQSQRYSLLVDDIGATAGVTVTTGTTIFAPVTGTIEYRPENALARNRPVTSLLMANAFWPADPFSRVRVTARWGWPVVPPRVKQATLLQALRLFSRLNSPQGVVGTAEWGQIRVSRLDPDVFNMLSDLTLPGFA